MRYEDKDVSIHSNIVVGPLIVELESPAILSCEIKLGDDMDFVKDYLYIFDKPDPDEGVSDKN